MASTEPCVVFLSVENKRFQTKHLEQPLVIELPSVEYSWQSEYEWDYNENVGGHLNDS